MSPPYYIPTVTPASTSPVASLSTFGEYLEGALLAGFCLLRGISESRPHQDDSQLEARTNFGTPHKDNPEGEPCRSYSVAAMGLPRACFVLIWA